MGILITLIGGVLGYSALKMYVLDPQVYAQKIEVARIDNEAKEERVRISILSMQNKEAIIVMQNNFDWISKAQSRLETQNSNIQSSQEEILKALKDLRNDRHR